MNGEVKLKMNRKYIFISILLGMFVCASVYSMGIAGKTNKSNDTLVSAQASWVNSYDSVGEMVRSSDLIVVGKVSEQDTELRHDWVFTNNRIDIKVTIIDKTATGAVNKSINVQQTGGVFDKHKTPHIEDVEVLQVGKEYLLFLQETDAGYFLVIGGITGAYGIDGDKLTYSGKHMPLNSELIGKGIESVLEEITVELAK
jgi:hypothetical protein